jgi:hypothetical protein
MLTFSNRKVGAPDFADYASRTAREWWQAGRRPHELFVLMDYGGTVAHLFTSAALAREYTRVLQLDVDASPILASELAAQAGVWIERGVETFVLDRCARCSAANFVPVEMVKNQEQFGQFWAFTLIVQEARMRRLAVSAFRSLMNKQVDEIVPKLKELRDHVNAGCPAVHYALALLVRAETPDQREELLAISKERLSELGRADLADNIPNGVEGLMRGFAVLRQMAEGHFEGVLTAETRLEVGIAVSQNR